MKEENKRESSGSLNSNELDTEGIKAAQRSELVVPGQYIAFFSKRRLIRIYFGPLSSRGFL